ncbi:unnamed protein product [marine sediment metagenome]|uniref:Uncharacterized protein n=1 Tax=marine sediment metagenome TaxID=412755 RepID=X1H540_9ZZZZ
MVKEILGYICLAGTIVSFVAMYLMPRFNRGKRPNPAKAKGEERLIRIEERTGLMIPLQLALIGAVLLT